MRFNFPDDEIKVNFEAAVEAAQMGRSPSTSLGFDAKTFDSLTDLAAATNLERDSLGSAARSELAKQLDGTCMGARHRRKS